MKKSGGMPVVPETHLKDLGPKKQGKVRDIYDLGDALLLVATDRISAFDVILPDGIPVRDMCSLRCRSSGLSGYGRWRISYLITSLPRL